MKKIAILLSLTAFILTLASCGGPEAYAKKMIRITKEITNNMEKAYDDNNISNKEAKKIEALLKEFTDLEKEIYQKYKNDEEARKEYYDYLNKKEYDEIEDDFYKAFSALRKCEGFNKIDIKEYWQ
ncbi:MAG: hypothetical protein PHS54_04655 [Clostridia bacterium]|nr:hypothetical protein [Clostridia bacterium]